MPVVDEARLNITIKADSMPLAGVNTELGKTVSLAGSADVKIKGMASSFLKSQIAMEGIKLGIGKAVDAFKTGMAEIEKDAAGLSRLKGAAASAGESFKTLSDAASNLSADNLIDFAQAAARIADLTQAGFKGDDLTKMATGLKDIAAAAGGNVAENMERLTEAFLTGRVNAAALQQMLPSLQGELEKLPKGASDAEKQQAFLNAVLKDSVTQAGAAQEKLGELSGKTQQLANDSDDLKKAWAEGVLKGFEGSGSIIGDTHKNMTELQTGVSGLATVLTTVLVVAFKGLKAAVDFAMIPLNSMVEWFIAAPGVVNQFQTALMNQVKSFEQFGQGLVTAIQTGIQQKWDSLKSWFTGKLQDLRNLLPSSDAREGPLSTLTAAGAAFWSTFATGLSRGEVTVLSAIQAGAAAVMNVLQNTIMKGISALTSGMGGIFGSLFKGLLGGLVSALGPIVASLIGKIADMFKHDWGKDISKRINEFLPGLQLSQQLIDQMTQDAEEFGDAGVAVFMNLGAAMADVGVNAQNAATFVGLLRNGFDLLNMGLITTGQLVDSIDQNFAELAKASTDSLGNVSDEILEIITLVQRFGLEVQAVTDFLTAQFQSQAESMNSLFANTTINSEREFNRMQMNLLTSANAMLASGMTVAQVSALLGPSLGSIAEAADRLGLSANAALQPFLQLEQVLNEFPKAAQKIQDVVTIMTTLHNTNSLTEEGFKSLERTGTNAARRIMADGELSAGEWAAIQPYIQQVIFLSEKYGFTLDKQTQKLIDMANANGFLLSTDPTADMEQGWERIRLEFDRLNGNFEVFINYLMQATGWAGQLGTAMGNIPGPPATGGYNPGPGQNPPAGPSYQGITQPHYVSGTERNVTLHSGESVMPKGWMQPGGSVPGSTNRVMGQRELNINIGKESIIRILIESEKDGTINLYQNP